MQGQRPGKLIVTIRPGAPSARAQASSRTFRLKRASRQLPAEKTRTLKLKLSAKARRSARSALAHDGKAEARIVAKATDAAGNTRKAKRRVKLR